jgi:LmbE family N-acetylglucosaminyl deacetylase
MQAWAPVRLSWVVCSAAGGREAEAVAGPRALLPEADVAPRILGFEDGRFPASLNAIKDAFESLKAEFSPDVIFTHARDDAHQDHRVVCELTWNTWRGAATILEYEIPKWDGDMGRPNAYVPLTEAQAEAKVAALFAAFPSQQGKRWFDPRVFLGLMRLRGMECASPSGYAEAFFARKLALG